MKSSSKFSIIATPPIQFTFSESWAPISPFSFSLIILWPCSRFRFYGLAAPGRTLNFMNYENTIKTNSNKRERPPSRFCFLMADGKKGKLHPLLGRRKRDITRWGGAVKWDIRFEFVVGEGTGYGSNFKSFLFR